MMGTMTVWVQVFYSENPPEQVPAAAVPQSQEQTSGSIMGQLPAAGQR